MSNNFTVNNNCATNKFYTVLGNEDFFDEKGYPRVNAENTLVLAKALQNKKARQLTNQNYQYRYYIKANPLKVIYNPIETHSIQKNNQHEYSHLHKTYKNEWGLIEVTESVFNKYIEFLKTKSLKWLKAAQQEIV